MINNYLDIVNDKQAVVINKLINIKAHVYIVGGFMRDYYFNVISNDLDLEVYNVPFDDLLTLFKDDIVYVNNSFKTIKLDGIEIALARYEKKKGYNYLDYQLTFDNVSINKAVKRRDFTINALMYDCNNNKLCDYVNALRDINNRVLRIVSVFKYREDSIRLLRMLKYCFKYDLKISFITKILNYRLDLNLFKQPSALVSKLFKDIIIQPYFNIDIFFTYLSNFLNIKAYKNYISNSIYHPEKSLYNHLKGSLLSLSYLDISNKNDYYLCFITLLFHDYGKLISDSQLSHELISSIYFNEVKEMFIVAKKEQKLVTDLINDHMKVREYAINKDIDKMKALKHQYKNRFYLLIIIGICDYSGRVIDCNKDMIIKRISEIKNILKEYDNLDG